MSLNFSVRRDTKLWTRHSLCSIVITLSSSRLSRISLPTVEGGCENLVMSCVVVGTYGIVWARKWHSISNLCRKVRLSLFFFSVGSPSSCMAACMAASVISVWMCVCEWVNEVCIMYVCMYSALSSLPFNNIKAISLHPDTIYGTSLDLILSRFLS